MPIGRTYLGKYCGGSPNMTQEDQQGVLENVQLLTSTIYYPPGLGYCSDTIY
jgi:hypothetical protein